MCKDCQTALIELRKEFNRKDAEALLYNATCFPFSGPKALEQAREAIAQHRRWGWSAGRIIQHVEDEMHQVIKAYDLNPIHPLLPRGRAPGCAT